MLLLSGAELVVAQPRGTLHACPDDGRRSKSHATVRAEWAKKRDEASRTGSCRPIMSCCVILHMHPPGFPRSRARLNPDLM